MAKHDKPVGGGTMQAAIEAAGLDTVAVAPEPVETLAEPTARRNRFSDLFTAIVFKSANQGATVYEREGDQSMSQKLANVLVEVAGLYYIRGGVKAVQPKGAADSYPEFTFFSTQHQGSVVVEDERAKAEYAEWKASVMIPAFMTWFESNRASITEIPADKPRLGISLKAKVKEAEAE